MKDFVSKHIIIFLSLSITLCQGARVLLVPWPMSSHVSHLVLIGEGLMKKGHEVHLLAAPTMPGLSKYKDRVNNVILYQVKDPDFYMVYEGQDMQDFMDAVTTITVKEDFRTNVHGMTEMCTNPLQDKDLYLKLKGLKFDIAIVDVFPCGRCMLVLMHRLGVPYIASETTTEPWLLRNLAMPSVFPSNIGNNAYTDRMNFMERLDNLWNAFEWAAFTNVAYLEDDFLSEYFYETPPVPLNKLAANAQLWLIDFNQMLDYPRPTMPNEIHVGGLSTKPAKPLPKDLEKIMNSNPNGVIIVSFGSFSADLPDRMTTPLIDALKRLPFSVIMATPANPPKDIPKNINFVAWLPQNDLLGHKNAKLFITHCGAAGQSEALYHGVPMLGIPIFGDQMYNAKRIVHHGFGKSFDNRHLQANVLEKAITEMMTNKTYTENIKHASHIFKDSVMTPKERAVYWVEHIIKYGGAHLRSYALDIPWYQYLMLDIFLFLITIVSLTLFAVTYITKKIFTLIFRSDEKKKVL